MVGDPALRFEVLGSLRAVRDDAALDLGPGKQRAVLAVLLVNANRPVSAAQIVDAVWRDSPPANGPNVVQKYVAGLRRVLEPGRSPRSEGRVLRLTDAGYVLEVAPGCLDTALFDSLVREARISRDEGKLNDAAAELRAALTLWRGEAYAGLAGPVVESERHRLAETRADALETVAEVELELGHHARLVPELTGLIAEFPLRERLRYLLMLALYRSGRQTEALAAFRSVRHHLAEEFGVEPGETLQRLHERILRADPALDLAPRDPLPPAPPPSPRPSRWRDPVATADPPEPEHHSARWPLWAGRAAAIALPLVSFGLAGWAVIVYFAVRRRSRPLAVAAFGYLACTALFAVIASDPNLREGSTEDTIAMWAWIVAMIGTVIHAAVLAFDPRHWPGHVR